MPLRQSQVAARTEPEAALGQRFPRERPWLVRNEQVVTPRAGLFLREHAVNHCDLRSSFRASVRSAQLDQRRGGRRRRQHHKSTAILMLIGCLRVELAKSVFTRLLIAWVQRRYGQRYLFPEVSIGISEIIISGEHRLARNHRRNGDCTKESYKIAHDERIS